MSQSRRARRMERHHQLAKGPGLNLVSLMDIFTILVFFLLVNSAGPQNLPSVKDLRMPSVVSLNPPAETLVLAVTKESVLLQGQALGNWTQWDANGATIVQALEQSLQQNAAKSPATEQGRAITLMADETVPYDIIEKLIDVCQAQDYRQIAFAANLKAAPKGSP
jgi:biopolymer transport protein ExbD